MYTNGRIGIAISSYNLGCFAGAILAMRFGQISGRRRAIFIGCTLVSIGAVLQFAAFGLPQFIIGRVICGLGTGINTYVPLGKLKLARCSLANEKQ